MQLLLGQRLAYNALIGRLAYAGYFDDVILDRLDHVLQSLNVQPGHDDLACKTGASETSGAPEITEISSAV